jgi:hypothetical protein
VCKSNNFDNRMEGVFFQIVYNLLVSCIISLSSEVK